MRSLPLLLLAALAALAVVGVVASTNAPLAASAQADATATDQSDHHAVLVSEALLRGAGQATVPNALAARIDLFWKQYTTSPSTAGSTQEASPAAPLSSLLSSLASDLFAISLSPAPINYCEFDYHVMPHIAEFWNTISNAGFIAVGLYGLITAARIGLRPRWYYVSTLILLTGVFSALYHATLTWVGLKSDELLENLACGILIYLGDRSMLLAIIHQMFATVGILCVTAFLFTELHLVTCMILSLRHLSMRTALSLRAPLLKAAVFLGLGFACWLTDRLACDIISPHLQLHAWWHVLIALAAQQALVLSVLTHGLEVRGKVQIGSWFGIAYLQAVENKRD